MKVGIFAGEAGPESGGGYTFVQEVVGQVARLGPTTGHEFVVLVTGSRGGPQVPLPTLELPSARTNWPLRARRALGRRLGTFLDRPGSALHAVDPRAEEAVRRAGIDLIWYVQPAAICTLSVPYITTVWDLQHRLQPFFPEVAQHGEFELRDDVYSTLLPRAALVITGNEIGSREIQRFYGVAPERILIAPHPTPAFALAETSPVARPDRAPHNPYLFYPAQYWPHKNHVNLLHALKLVREGHGLPFSLVLSGSDQGNRSYVLDQARHLGLSEAVVDLGFVDRDELVALYRHAFALCYVTFFGPENMPPLEAFALGCPVVASDVAGAREQLGDAAILVDAMQPEQIAAAVVRLQQEPELVKALRDRGATRARAFTGREFVGRVVAWLDQFAAIRRNWASGAQR